MALLREAEGSAEFRLRGEVVVLGRSPACDIVIATGQTSSRHARIINLSGVYYVEDLESLNGTFVNGKRIDKRTHLAAGDRLEFFGQTFVFEEEPTPSTEVRATRTLTNLTPVPDPASILSSIDVVRDLRIEVAAEAKLRAVLEISKNLSSSLDLANVLPKILESLFTLFPQADHGSILLDDPDTGQLVPKAIRHRRPDESDSLPISRTIMNYALESGRALLSLDAGRDERFDPSQSVRLFDIHSIMCVPMFSQSGSRLGVIQINTRDKRKQFKQEDLDVLVFASTQASRAVELARLHQERRDLETATQIQKSFLPSERPQIAELEFFDHYSAAKHIGGDYYDYINLPGNRLAITIGDVSGKGVPAALLMARLSAAARSCLASEPNVPAAVSHLSAMMTRSETADRFVTFVVVVLNLDTWSMNLVIAGHPPPLLRRPGQEEVPYLGEEIISLPLAVAERPYKELAVSLEPGDTLVLYTDGVTEARNPQGDLYGIDRFRAALATGPDDPALLGQAILADVQQFSIDRPQADDLTLVCFRRRATS
jgi:serine phosphatase RsbU (regulator of sigma subunit)